MIRSKCFALSLFTVAAVGCNKAPEPAQTVAPAQPKAAPQGGAPAPASKVSAKQLSGTILERAEGGGYTYLKLKTANGDVWTAVGKTDKAVGDTVTLQRPLEMRDFKSKALGRTFKTIYFGTLAGAPGSQPAAQPGSQPAVRAGSQPAARPASQPALKMPKPAPAVVPPAPGALAIEKVYADSAALKGKTVKITGKVVKFSPQIMGKNWAHLQDGSGDMKKGTHDLTVTTQATLKIGDIATLEGILATDKDFGAGYRYPVILEEAKVP